MMERGSARVSWRWVAISIAIASTAVAAGYLNRWKTIDNPAFGILTYRWEWGCARVVEADTNRDGRIDVRARFAGNPTVFFTHAPLEEYREDADFDGVFELLVRYSAGAEESWLLDEDEDGVYERVLSPSEARSYYSDRSAALRESMGGKAG